MEDSIEAVPKSCTCILIVEDEILIAIDMQLELEQGGFEVLGPARSVRSALALLETSAPDAAVLDLNLHDELVTPIALALRQRGIPFLLASADSQGSLASETVLAGVENIGKMRAPGELVVAVAGLLRLNSNTHWTKSTGYQKHSNSWSK